MVDYDNQKNVYMKVLTIGGATLDTIIEYENMGNMELQTSQTKDAYLLLKEGAKIEVKTQKSFSGGGATNTAISFKKLGFDVTFFGKVGKDDIGMRLLQELKSKGIDTSIIRYSNKFNTANSYVIPSLKGDRTIFAYRGANRDLLTEDLPISEIKAADFVYVTSLSKQSARQLPKIVEIAKNANTKVAINPGISQLESGSCSIKNSLDGIDILIMNYEESKKFMQSLFDKENNEYFSIAKNNLLKMQPVFQDNLFSLKAFFKKILSLGPKIVVVTHGSEGVYVATQEKMYFHPALEVENVINTLGAGDAFGSTFCGTIFNQGTVENAIMFGLINSSSVIKFHDAKSGLLNDKELIETAKKITHNFNIIKTI